MRRMLLVALCLTLVVALPLPRRHAHSLRLGGDICSTVGPGVFSGGSGRTPA